MSNQPETICEVFGRTSRDGGGRVAQRRLDGSSVAWDELRSAVHRLAGGLSAWGIARGETVALMMSNRPEHLLCDMAVLYAGGTPLSIYLTSPAGEIAYLLDDAAVSIVICEATVEPVLREAVGLSGREPRVVVLGAQGSGGLEPLFEACPPDFDPVATMGQVLAEDVAVIVYTSGTTGQPKGVQLTHRNLAGMWRAARSLDPRIDHLQRVVSYLPTAHVGDRLWQYVVPLHTGATITYVPDPSQLAATLAEVRPSFFIGVPRIWEKLRIALGAMVPEGRAAEEPEIAAMLRERLGIDEDAIAYTGAAPLDTDVLGFFDAIGVPLLEGYGMTESSGVISTTRVGQRRAGSVGTAFDGVEVSLASDGEILVRGEDVLMLGYRNKPGQTAEAIGEDGWLRTGDVGRIDDDGMLTVVDRKKELIITAGGKNISPANVENAIRTATHLAGPVLAVGDRRPYVTAIISLDEAESRAWAEAHGRGALGPEQLAGDAELLEAVAAAIEQANRGLSRVSQVKRFVIVPDVWDPASGKVTPTLKLRRRRVTEAYASEIDRLYL